MAKMQSDIMIVKLSEKDYYVSEKLHDKEPYHKLLIIRGQNSKHYKTLTEARAMAEKMRTYVIKTSPDCVIVEIDIRQYPKNKKQPPVPIEYQYDDDNQVVFGVTEKGKKVFELKNDAPYIFIDLISYKNKIDRVALTIDINSLHFKNLGKERAYKLAYNCSLPYLRYEIYKAKKLLHTFEYDLELHQYDIEFYLGYIMGLNEAISIQKECTLMVRNDWKIHIFDLDNSHIFEIVQNYINLNFGEYTIIIHQNIDDFVGSNMPNEIYIFFIDKTTDKCSLISNVKLNNHQLIIFDTHKSGKPINNAYIELLAEKLFKLGKGNGDLKINEQWISEQDE